MKLAKELTKEESQVIVELVQHLLFFDISDPEAENQSEDIWNSNKDIDGADFIESMIDIFDCYGLVPNGIEKVD